MFTRELNDGEEIFMTNILITRTGDSFAVVNGRHRLEVMLSAFGKATVTIDGIDSAVYRTPEGKLKLVDGAAELIGDQAVGPRRQPS